MRLGGWVVYVMPSSYTNQQKHQEILMYSCLGDQTNFMSPFQWGTGNLLDSWLRKDLFVKLSHWGFSMKFSVTKCFGHGNRQWQILSTSKSLVPKLLAVCNRSNRKSPYSNQLHYLVDHCHMFCRELHGNLWLLKFPSKRIRKLRISKDPQIFANSISTSINPMASGEGSVGHTTG